MTMINGRVAGTGKPIAIRVNADGSLAVNSYATATANFTRPANTTGYTAGDVVSNNTTTTVLMQFDTGTISGGEIVKAVFKTDNPLWTGKQRLWLTNVAANVPVADNVAQAMAYTSSEIGYIDIEMVASGTACATGMVKDFSLPFKPDAAGKIYGWFTTVVNQTPVSEQKYSAELTFAN